MNLLITGVAGFIGSHFAHYCVTRGHNVIGVDNFDQTLYDKKKKIENLEILLRSENFTFHYSSLGEIEIDLEDVVVVNFGAIAGQRYSWANPGAYFDSNAIQPSNLLKALAIRGSAKYFIQISTSSVYGRIATTDEGGNLNPSSPYGASKIAGENLLKIHADQYNIPLLVLRLFSVYGPNQRPDMAYARIIHSLLTGEEFNIFGSGHQLRTNTYITDVVDVIYSQVLTCKNQGIFNIGGTESISLLDAIEILEDFSGLKLLVKKSEVEIGDQLETRAEITKASKHLDYLPKVPLIEGLINQFTYEHQKIIK